MTSARRLVKRYSEPRILSAIRAWLIQIEVGEDVGPGLLVYYIREGIELGIAAEPDWLERRYKRAQG